MTTTEYENYVTSRCLPYTDEPYCVITLNEEAGEVAGWYKKFVLRGNVTGEFSREDLKGELGDIQFYLTRLASLNGWSLEDIMKHNKVKLDQRIAEGKKGIA